MTSSTCWRCLSRLKAQPRNGPPFVLLPTPPAQSLRAFTSTSQLQAGAVRQAPSKRGRPALKLKKNKRVKSYQIPAIGERKALRNRIVLSNSNALEPEDLDDFTLENASRTNNIGQVLQFRGTTVDSLRSCEAFRTSQRWGYFKRPSSMIRPETRGLADLIEDCDASEARGQFMAMIVGSRGTGKSVLLLQAQALALMKGWVVITFPDARDLTNATTAYAPVPNTNPTQYIQKDYAAALLARIAKTNSTALSTQPILRQHPNLPPQFANLQSLQRLAETGANEPDAAWPAFQALWTELTIPNAELNKGNLRRKPRPPIMMTMDGVANIERLSNYLAPDMHYIHAHDLVIVKHFVDHISGVKELVNGGAVLAADSQSNRPSSPALDLAIRQSEERRQQMADGETDKELPEQPLYDPESPWDRIDERSLVALRGVPTMRLGNLERDNCRTLLEYYAKNGMLRTPVTDGLVTEAFSLSGGGNIKQLENVSISTGMV